MELRAQYEAAEAREADRRQSGVEGGATTEEEPEEEAGAEDGAKVKKKKKVAAEPKPKRTRTPKQIRQRVVWVVFDNSHKAVQQFDYSHKQEAVDMAERLKTEKKSTYFVQPVKEEIKD